MLSKGNWQLMDYYGEMNIVQYLNYLSFELMKRKEREDRLERALMMSKKSATPYQTALLMEILKCL
jgi:hypothetical protein